MVKKLQKMAEKQAESKGLLPAGLMDSQLAQTIKDSAQQIWLAGLGAFAKAQGEGGKVFDTLIKEGTSLQRKTQAAAEGTLGDVADRMTAMAGEVGSKANTQWDKLESIFEERTARALSRLGVPTAKEVAALSARVDALAAALAPHHSAAAGPQAVVRFRPGKALKEAAPVAAPQPAARKASRKKLAESSAATAVAPAAAPAAATAAPRKRTRRAAGG